jgi:flagellar assembly protein FliH
MSSLPRLRIIRAAEASGDVFVLGQENRSLSGAESSVSDAMTLVRNASEKAASIVAQAEHEAAAIRQRAAEEQVAVHEAARQQGYEAGSAEGFAAGHAEATARFADYLDLLRKAAEQGQQVRDQVANDAAPVVARAAMLAVRRIVGEYYESDPARTAETVREALRSASGQEILSVRVHPDVAGRVSAALIEGTHYVQPDEGVAIGGCIIDLREGSIDASLSTRLDLMEMALTRAAGEPQS